MLHMTALCCNTAVTAIANSNTESAPGISEQIDLGSDSPTVLTASQKDLQVVETKSENTFSLILSMSNEFKLIRLLCKCGNCNLADFVNSMDKMPDPCIQLGERSLSLLVHFIKSNEDQRPCKNELAYLDLCHIASQRADELQAEFEILVEDTFRKLKCSLKVNFKDVIKFLFDLLVHVQSRYYTDPARKKELTSVKTYNELKAILLHTYCSWFHYELIGDVRKKYCFNEGQADEKMCLYEKNCTRFVDHGLFKYVEDLFPRFRTANYYDVVCKLKLQIAEITLDHVMCIKRLVLDCMVPIPEYTLILKCLQDSSGFLKIYFRAPSYVTYFTKTTLSR